MGGSGNFKNKVNRTFDPRNNLTPVFHDYFGGKRFPAVHLPNFLTSTRVGRRRRSPLGSERRGRVGRRAANGSGATDSL